MNVLNLLRKQYLDGKNISLYIEEQKYLFKGKYKQNSYDTITITELPVGVWTSNYKEFLEIINFPFS